MLFIIEIIHFQLAFAECMLPLLTQMLLTCEHTSDLVSILIESVSTFFEKHLECSQVCLILVTNV